jgi:hypothetical protein
MVIQRKPGKMTADTHSPTVRRPAVAGLFYAADRDASSSPSCATDSSSRSPH